MDEVFETVFVADLPARGTGQDFIADGSLVVVQLWYESEKIIILEHLGVVPILCYICVAQ
jgi:hypothetical protein